MMKKFVAIIGLVLLIIPLLRHITFERRLNKSDSAFEVISALASISSGLMCGFFGLIILGFLMDGGSGYRKPALYFSLAVLGVLWIVFYPSGWMLGIPLVIYPLSRRFGWSAKAENVQQQ